MRRWLAAQQQSRLERRDGVGALCWPCCPWLYPQSTQQGDGGSDIYTGPFNPKPRVLAGSCITFQSFPKTTADTESHLLSGVLHLGPRKLGWKK